MTVAKKPSVPTLLITCWCGFMFATAVAALIPSLQLLVAPIACHAPYSHGVVQVHDYSYGTTSGYTIFLRCANANHQERGTSIIEVIGLLWLFGWIASLLIWGAIYWLRVLIVGPQDAARDERIKRLRATGWRPRLVTPDGPSGTTPGSRPTAAAGMNPIARPAPPLRRSASRLDELARLADLYDRGALSDEEFSAEKAKVLTRD